MEDDDDCDDDGGDDDVDGDDVDGDDDDDVDDDDDDDDSWATIPRGKGFTSVLYTHVHKHTQIN